MNLRSPWLSIWTLWEKFWSAGDRKRSLYIIYEHYGIFYVDKWHISRIFKATFPCKISIIFRYGAFRNTFLSRKSNFSCRILPIAHMNWKISVRPVYSDSWISFSACYFQHHFEHYFSSDSSGRKSTLKYAATDHSVGVVLGWFFHKCVRSCVCFDTQYVHPPNAFCQVKKRRQILNHIWTILSDRKAPNTSLYNSNLRFFMKTGQDALEPHWWVSK